MKANEIKRSAIFQLDGKNIFVKKVHVQSPSSRSGNTLYKVSGYDIVSRQKFERSFKGDEVVDNVDVLQKRVEFDANYFLGVDVARMGTDESTFEILERVSRDKLLHRENIVTTKTLTTDTTKQIVFLNNQYNFKRIYIDDGGMGVGVFDQLLEYEETRRKTEAINNASRSLDRDEKRKKKLLKEDLYNNLLRLMERGEIELLDDDNIFFSLKSVMYEYTDEGKLRLFGRYTHIAEGLIRAAWCAKDKHLNICIV